MARNAFACFATHERHSNIKSVGAAFRIRGDVGHASAFMKNRRTEQAQQNLSRSVSLMPARAAGHNIRRGRNIIENSNKSLRFHAPGKTGLEHHIDD